MIEVGFYRPSVTSVDFLHPGFFGPNCACAFLLAKGESRI